MWLSTGKSANAALIHCALHPVATSEMLKIRDSMILLIEFAFMSVLLLQLLLIWIVEVAITTWRQPPEPAQSEAEGAVQPSEARQ
jgi:hypothetical protein